MVSELSQAESMPGWKGKEAESVTAQSHTQKFAVSCVRLLSFVKEKSARLLQVPHRMSHQCDNMLERGRIAIPT